MPTTRITVRLEYTDYQVGWTLDIVSPEGADLVRWGQRTDLDEWDGGLRNAGTTPTLDFESLRQLERDLADALDDVWVDGSNAVLGHGVDVGHIATVLRIRGYDVRVVV